MAATVKLKVEGLTKRYSGIAAVDDLSMEVMQGEVFGFLGPNGAGKTTTIHMICGLLEPDSGSIFIDGIRLNGNGRQRRKIGFCPQENIFWTRLSCLEQLVFIGEMYGLKRGHARERGFALLRSMGLYERKNSLACTLSGGMKRRLNLCLALIHEPEIVVLDEPETGLDPQSRVMVREFIRSLAMDKTVILTTHNMDEAERLANRVAIIDHGKLLMLDTVANLKRSIGQGDMIEMDLHSGDETSLQKALLAIADLPGIMVYDAPVLSFRSPEILARTAEISAILSASYIEAKNIRMRETSLEDVFIHLTGRPLRES